MEKTLTELIFSGCFEPHGGACDRIYCETVREYGKIKAQEKEQEIINYLKNEIVITTEKVYQTDKLQLMRVTPEIYFQNVYDTFKLHILVEILSSIKQGEI